MVDSDIECLNLLFQTWFLDDGIIAGRSDVQHVLSLIDELETTQYPVSKVTQHNQLRGVFSEIHS